MDGTDAALEGEGGRGANKAKRDVSFFFFFPSDGRSESGGNDIDDDEDGDERCVGRALLWAVGTQGEEMNRNRSGEFA